MGKAILALVTALAITIPTLFAWKQSRDKKKAVKELEKRKSEIRHAVASGNVDVVKRTLAKWL